MRWNWDFNFKLSENYSFFCIIFTKPCRKPSSTSRQQARKCLRKMISSINFQPLRLIQQQLISNRFLNLPLRIGKRKKFAKGRKMTAIIESMPTKTAPASTMKKNQRNQQTLSMIWINRLNSMRQLSANLVQSMTTRARNQRTNSLLTLRSKKNEQKLLNSFIYLKPFLI